MPAPLLQLSQRLERFDRRALAFYVVLPVVLYVPWAVAGHPVLNGDNLTQNYPLRVLAGELIRHGRLPLWDPAIWSGAPLLAGWNAGAMYPGTWLFAVLPGVAAWVVNLVSVGIIAGVGTHLFLRRLGCSPLAALLGALVFSYTGFMSGQSLHIGLVEGMAFLPWGLLGLDWIARTRSPRFLDLAWPVTLLGVSSGLVVLAGDPRAISNDAIVLGIYLIACCYRSVRARWPDQEAGPSGVFTLLAGVLAALVLGAALSAVQWLPGLAFLHQSQRGASSYYYFTGGSLGYNDLSYLLVPFVYGGNGNFQMPQFAGAYNLPELTYGVGLLPLTALLVLSWRAARGRAKNVAVWVVMFLVGALLCAGGNTPLGHLLVHLPLYGGQRLQNRNSAISDAALAVLLALFVDTLPASCNRRSLEATAGETGDRSSSAERLLGLVPPALAAALVISMLAAPVATEMFISPGGSRDSRLPGQMAAYYAVVLLLATATSVLLLRRTWRRIAARSLAAAIVLADVLVFVLFATYQPAPPEALAASSPAADQLANVAPSPPGRWAIFNPQQTPLGNPYRKLFDVLGGNDLTILHHMWSVQGYGSAVSADYENATGAHEVENLRPSSFLSPTYDTLNLTTLVTTPALFGAPVKDPSAAPRPAGPPRPPGTSPYDTQPGNLVYFGRYPPNGPWSLPAGGMLPFFLPGPVVVESIVVRFDPSYGDVPGHLEATLLTRAGAAVTATARVEAAGATVTLSPGASTVAADGGAWSLELSVPGDVNRARPPVVSSVAVLVRAGPGTWLTPGGPARGTAWFALDGLLQGLITPRQWHFARLIGPLVLLRNENAYGPAWLEQPTATQPDQPRAPGTVTEAIVPDWASPRDVVDSPKAALLVRSESYAAGWSVTLSPTAAKPGETAVTLPVRRIGLLQGVEIPPGEYVVTWHYTSKRALVGFVAGAAGTVAAIGLAVLGAVRRRRQRSLPQRDSLPHALRDLDRDRAALD